MKNIANRERNLYMSENEKKTFEVEEDPFAGVPGLDPTLKWSEEAYYLVLLAKDASEIERRTDIKPEDWLWAADKFKSEKEYEKAALCLTMAAKTDKTDGKKRRKET